MYLGEPHDSYVHGSVIDGVFSGRIRRKREVFYVEKSELYFKGKQDFHSVIYHDRHVDENAVRLRSCVAVILIIKWTLAHIVEQPHVCIGGSEAWRRLTVEAKTSALTRGCGRFRARKFRPYTS